MGWHRDVAMWASVQVLALASRAHGAERSRLADQGAYLMRRAFAVELAAILDGVA